MSALKNSETSLNEDIEKIRQKLWRTRVVKVKAEGRALPAGEGVSYQGAFFVAVSDRIKDLTLEKQNLLRQINDPDQRTRLKVLFPATLEQKPFESKRRNAAMVTTVLGCLFLFGFVFYKELTHPIARDDWRIERRTDRPILTQVSAASLTRYTKISPLEADNLRENLKSNNKKDIGTRTILSYRRLELAIDQNRQGNVILLTSAGSADSLGQAIYSFLNIYSTDVGKRCVVVDCDNTDPIFHPPKDSELVDFIDVLDGTASLDQAILKQDAKELGFDYLPPSEKYKGEKTRAFNSEKVEPYIEKLAQSYDLVFLRSFPEYMFIENTVLIKSATDSIICVDSMRTSYSDLDRTITHLDSDQLRGLVLMGT